MILSGITNAKAQDGYDITFEEPAFKLGLLAAPSGFAVFFRNVNPTTQRKLFRAWEINIGNIKNSREKSILNQRMVNASPYIYGKVNRFYTIRPMYGIQRTFAEKINRNSIGISLFALAGPSIGILKPVFIDIEVLDPQLGVFVSKAVRYEPEKYSPNIISGYSPYFTGIEKSVFQMGISFKAGIEFNWGYYVSDFKSIETGIMLDCFPSRPELMYGIRNKVIYSSFYLSFALGKNY